MDKAQMVELVMHLRQEVASIERSASALQKAIAQLEVERKYTQDRIDELNEKILAQDTASITEASDH